MRPAATTDALISSLLSPSIYGGNVTAVRLVETHISWVILTGKYAYKIKKPLKLPFLDFTTLDARHRYCQEELRLNSRLAPELYLDVISIGGRSDRPVLGQQPAIEYAVKMVEFSDEARLDRRIAAAAISDADIAAFAESIGRFHAALPPAASDSAFGTATQVVAGVDRNAQEAAAVIAGGLEPDAVIRRNLTLLGSKLTPVIDARKQSGAVREGHGDLHLENLVYWQSRIVPFDALEFDPALRWIDVIDEAAFVMMDLMAHGRTDLAYRFINRYLEVTGDYEGLAVLRYYLIHRALVRAKVRAIKAEQTHADAADPQTCAYLELGERLAAPPSPVLIITHGLSGSGKTTWTDLLLPALPAVRLRSDLVRKQLVGLDEHASSYSPVGGGIYAAETSKQAYAELARGALAGLTAGFSIIVDAAFLRSQQRQQFAEIAARARSGFAILDCHAPIDTLRQRIALRQAQSRDASEATVAVLDHQLATRDQLTPAELAHAVHIDTEARPPLEQIVAGIEAARC